MNQAGVPDHVVVVAYRIPVPEGAVPVAPDACVLTSDGVCDHETSLTTSCGRTAAASTPTTSPSTVVSSVGAASWSALPADTASPFPMDVAAEPWPVDCVRIGYSVRGGGGGGERGTGVELRGRDRHRLDAAGYKGGGGDELGSGDDGLCMALDPFEMMEPWLDADVARSGVAVTSRGGSDGCGVDTVVDGALLSSALSA